VGASPDRVWLQNPANAGTLQSPVTVGADLGLDAGFDIAGQDNVAYLAGVPRGGDGARLFQVDVSNGERRQLGRIGRGHVTLTGVAAV
jgi:hypothetical protein